MSPPLAFGGRWSRQAWQNGFQLLEDELLHVLGAALHVRDPKWDGGVDHEGRPDVGRLWCERNTKTPLEGKHLQRFKPGLNESQSSGSKSTGKTVSPSAASLGRLRNWKPRGGQSPEVF